MGKDDFGDNETCVGLEQNLSLLEIERRGTLRRWYTQGQG